MSSSVRCSGCWRRLWHERSYLCVDVLVSFAQDAHWSLFDMVQMQEELEILGRDVDLVSRRAIEASRNYIRRKAILSSAEVVYGT